MPSDLNNPLYNDPSVYDILHAGGTAAEVAGLERTAERFCRGRARELPWLEPACGTGRYVRVAARRGRGIVGFDLSASMVEYAERRLATEAGMREQAGGEARVFVGDMTRFADRLPEITGSGRADGAFGFAFCLINTFRHLGAGAGTDEAALAHLGEMRRVLDPGAVYAVGIHLTTYGAEDPSEDVWTGQRGAKHVTQVVQYEPATRKARLERVISHLVIDTGAEEQHADAVYALRSYDRGEWDRLLDQAGWEEIGCVDEHGEDHAVGAFGYGIFLIRPR